MSLAGTWYEASDGGPSVTLYLIVAILSVATAVTVLLALRWRDRRQQLRERQPWRQVILHNQQTGEEVQRVAERHERIIRERGQWLADQVTEQGERLEAINRVVTELHDIAVAANVCNPDDPRRHLHVVPDD